MNDITTSSSITILSYPGLLVKAVVEEIITSSGLLLVRCVDAFSGFIDTGNLSLETLPDIGTVLKARVIFIDPIDKTIRLSLQPHILSLRSPTLPPLGMSHR